MMRASRNAKAMSAEEWSKAGSFMRKPEKGWLHSDQAIKEGGVCYALKYLGCIEVLKSMRTLQYDVRQHVTKEAMYRCCEANGYKFSKRKKANKNVLKLLADHPRTSDSGRFISFTVSVTGIVITEMSSGKMITKHDMQGISFASGGEKECPDIVGYVAKDAKNKRACHVLDCPQNLSYDVINTIGQAFELRYKMFLHDPPQVLTPPKRFDAVFEVEDEKPIYDEPKDEPGVFEDSNTYDYVADEPQVNSDDNDSLNEYKVPVPRSPPCKMSEYDTPETTLESQPNIDYFDIENPNESVKSMEFNVGTQFHAPATGQLVSPTYNNPLVSILPDNDLNLYDDPGTNVNIEPESVVNNHEPESTHVPFRTSWETFDEPAPSASPILPYEPLPANFDEGTSPLHNTLGYALILPKKPPIEVQRKTPPPLPKPFARRNDSQEAEKPSNAVENDLRNNVWFHGPMTRSDAENLLSCDGDFLVRESTTNPGQYVLTGQQNGYPKHLLLVDPVGVVRTRDQTFDSVSHLVQYHQEKKIPIISSGSVLILKQAVVKNSNPQYDGPCK